MNRLILYPLRYKDRKTWILLHIITVILVKERLVRKSIVIFDLLFDGVNQNYILLFVHDKKSQLTCEKHPKIMFLHFFFG